MRPLAKEFRSLGYERTEKESPFDEDGTLWTNSYELVCDKTGLVIRKDVSKNSNKNYDTSWPQKERHEYQNSERTKMAGGYIRPYAESDGIYGNG
jgi:hypothetical protein